MGFPASSDAFVRMQALMSIIKRREGVSSPLDPGRLDPPVYANYFKPQTQQTFRGFVSFVIYAFKIWRKNLCIHQVLRFRVVRIHIRVIIAPFCQQLVESGDTSAETNLRLLLRHRGPSRLIEHREYLFCSFSWGMID